MLFSQTIHFNNAGYKRDSWMQINIIALRWDMLSMHAITFTVLHFTRIETVNWMDFFLTFDPLKIKFIEQGCPVTPSLFYFTILMFRMLCNDIYLHI